jgi:hypothetical protein
MKQWVEPESIKVVIVHVGVDTGHNGDKEMTRDPEQGADALRRTALSAREESTQPTPRAACRLLTIFPAPPEFPESQNSSQRGL